MLHNLYALVTLAFAAGAVHAQTNIHTAQVSSRTACPELQIGIGIEQDLPPATSGKEFIVGLNRAGDGLDVLDSKPFTQGDASPPICGPFGLLNVKCNGPDIDPAIIPLGITFIANGSSLTTSCDRTEKFFALVENRVVGFEVCCGLR